MKRPALSAALIFFIASFAHAGESVADLLDVAQKDAFRYMWDYGDPASGMAYEANYDWDVRPVAAGGTGFGVAAVVAATNRGWITRDDAVARLLKITRFLRDKSPRERLHGAFPHWMNGTTGDAIVFGENDAAADIVETSLLMQGLLIARAYFAGPGPERALREIITELWEDVDWNWFTNNEENGLYWHWDPSHGFYHGLKILGYNECLITYVLAAASPTHPISRKAYDYWTSGPDYAARDVRGYRIEATSPSGGPLFMSQYSFVGLDPRRLADAWVKDGYFVRSVKQTLANRDYCLYAAPPENQYDESFWGLTACQIPGGYAACSPDLDKGVVAPTAALSAFPFTPWQSLQVLKRLRGDLKEKVWGEHGPMDAVSLKEDWVSDKYLAIDQLPIVCMIENYRSGLLWDLLMSDPDVRKGLETAGLTVPNHRDGFPELVEPLHRENGDENNKAVPGPVELLPHPDTGKYEVPFWSVGGGRTDFTIIRKDAKPYVTASQAAPGRNILDLTDAPLPKNENLIIRLRNGPVDERVTIRLRTD